MKIIKITLLLVAALLALTACDTNESITQPRSIVNIPDANDDFVSVKGAGPSVDPYVPVWDDRNFEAGYIYLANDANNLYVTYYMSENWLMSEANLHVARSIEQIPRDVNGIPLPDQFAYQSPSNRCSTVYSYSIPLTQLGVQVGDDIVVASQASLAPNKASSPGSDVLQTCGDLDSTVNWWYVGNSRIRVNLNGTNGTERVEIGRIPIQNSKA